MSALCKLPIRTIRSFGSRRVAGYPPRQKRFSPARRVERICLCRAYNRSCKRMLVSLRVDTDQSAAPGPPKLSQVRRRAATWMPMSSIQLIRLTRGHRDGDICHYIVAAALAMSRRRRCYTVRGVQPVDSRMLGLGRCGMVERHLRAR